MKPEILEKKPASELTTEELQNLLTSRTAKADTEKKNRIKIFHKTKDDFVRETATIFTDFSSQLAELKEMIIRKGNELYIEMFEMHEKEPKEQKSFSFTTDDDQFKLEIERAEKFVFTEEANVHISSIQEIFKVKYAKNNKAMYNYLEAILMKGNKSEYDPKLLTKARRQAKDLGDDDLVAELNKLQDCQKVVGSAMYCRVKARNNSGKWETLNIQFSAL